jgi:ATP-dependent Lon protease
MAPKIQKKGENKRRGRRDPDSDSESEFNESDMSSTEESSVSEEKPKRKTTKKIAKKAPKKEEKKEEKKDAKKDVKSKDKKKSKVSEEDEEAAFDKKGYAEFLASLFPSKFSKQKAKEAAEEEDDEEHSPKKKKSIKSRISVIEDDDDDDDDEDYEEESDEDDDDEEDDEEESDEDDDDEDDEEESDEDDDESSESDDESEEKGKKKKKGGKINIILSVGGGNTEEEDEYNEYFGIEDDDEDDEDEDEECDTDDEETFMKEKYEKIEQPEQVTDGDSDTKVSDSSKKEKASKKKKDKKSKETADAESTVDVESEYIELLELKKDLTKKLHKNPKSKILKKAIAECSTDIRKLVKDARKNNTKEYRKLIYSESEKPSEMNYFKTKMSNAEQRRIMSELKEINQHMGVDKPYRLALLESSIPPKLKATAMQKINMIRSMDTCDPEYFKIKNWVDTFMRIPFCKYSSLSVSITDGIESCHDFMSNAKGILDKCVYGLDDAKLQILQMVGQWISNPQAMGTAIAIKGPPGTGKTTLVKDGISKILGREFVFIPLGGTGDASFLEGHSYTYEGSTWGKIVQSLIDCKCMNPVFYFDELDKISDTPKGEEITGILTHLTDTSQNSQFHDKYFSEVDFDLSKCLFIFSYNDESKVNPILRDRMYRIQTKGYDAKEKIVIARNYMLPKIREQVGFQPEEVVIPDETIKHIVGAKHLTQEEDGVRNMKRCLEIIHTKLNLFRLMKPDENLFEKEIKLEVQFPYTVSPKIVDILIKNEENQRNSILNSMYI